MKLHYYADTDSLHVELKDAPGVETREVADGLNVDLDAAGDVVGFDMDHAAKRFDLTTLEVDALPVPKYRPNQGDDLDPITGRLQGLALAHKQRPLSATERMPWAPFTRNC